MMHMLAIYDIADNKRLNQVARILKNFGTRVQKSKFEIDVTQAQFKALQAKIANIIDFEEDGVKYVPLCPKCRAKTEIIGLGKYIDPDEEFFVF